MRSSGDEDAKSEADPGDGVPLALGPERIGCDSCWRQDPHPAVGLRGRHASATRVLIATEMLIRRSRPGEPATPRGAKERQTAEVASCLWSDPTLTSMRRGFACSATGMATVNTPPS